MSSAAETVENASIISESMAHDGNRLWIGNIDPKITEWVHKVNQINLYFYIKIPLKTYLSNPNPNPINLYNNNILCS